MSGNNNEVFSAQLTPYSGSISGVIGASSLIVNDYLITLIQNDGSYELQVKKGSQTQSVVVEDAVSIESVTQVAESHESGGTNTVRVLLSNGEFTDFNFYNGEKGDKGDPGLSLVERQEIIDAEIARVIAESERASAENDRSDSEEDRKLYETLRRNAENERIQQEKNRISAEATRASAESAREGAEAVRQYNEIERENAEDARSQGWTELQGDVNDAISQIVDLREGVEDLADKVDGAAGDVLEAYINVNNHITRSEGLLEQVEEASSDIIHMTAEAETLSPESEATASYSNGVLTLGIPQGIQGDDYVLTSQDKSDIGEQALDKLGMYVDEDGYIRQEVDGDSLTPHDVGEKLATEATLQSIVDAIESLPGSAQDAADAANAAAVLATTKAELANNAASLANEKAALANSAATLANTKADLANTAAQTANQAVEDLGDAATAKTAAESAQAAAESAADSAQDYKETVENLVDGIAQEDTAESIQGLLVQINGWLEQIAENGMGGGDLNGFSLSLNGSNQVVLSYTNPEDETDTASAILATNTTGNAIIEDLQGINASMRLLIPETEGE